MNDDHMEGFGRLTTPQYTYTGDLKLGVQEGFGTLVTPKNSFCGNFINGKKQGIGALFDAKGNLELACEWKNGKIHGKALFFKSQNTGYFGVYDNGQLTKQLNWDTKKDFQTTLEPVLNLKKIQNSYTQKIKEYEAIIKKQEDIVLDKMNDLKNQKLVLKKEAGVLEKKIQNLNQKAKDLEMSTKLDIKELSKELSGQDGLIIQVLLDRFSEDFDIGSLAPSKIFNYAENIKPLQFLEDDIVDGIDGLNMKENEAQVGLDDQKNVKKKSGSIDSDKLSKDDCNTSEIYIKEEMDSKEEQNSEKPGLSDRNSEKDIDFYSDRFSDHSKSFKSKSLDSGKEKQRDEESEDSFLNTDNSFDEEKEKKKMPSETKNKVTKVSDTKTKTKAKKTVTPAAQNNEIRDKKKLRKMRPDNKTSKNLPEKKSIKQQITNPQPVLEKDNIKPIIYQDASISLLLLSTSLPVSKEYLKDNYETDPEYIETLNLFLDESQSDKSSNQYFKELKQLRGTKLVLPKYGQVLKSENRLGKIKKKENMYKKETEILEGIFDVWESNVASSDSDYE